MDRQEELFQQLIDKISTLSYENKQIVSWLIAHIAFLDLIDESIILSEDEFRVWEDRAKKENDYSLSAMVHYKRLKDKKRAEK